MRIAVISDVHGNAHALDAVLRALDDERPDAVWCLGDLVGYGPRPNRCCARVRDRADLVLAGNHDLAVLGTIEIEEFSHDAATSARWTREVLEEDSRAYLASLEPSAVAEGAELYHGSPRDPVWEYVLSEQTAQVAFALTTAPLVLVGHSHVALALVLEGDRLTGGLAPADTEIELGGARWLLNPGSVGQPRDGDPRAAYLLLDTEAGSATFRRVPYAVERTQAEIRERGLPLSLGERLALGE